MNTYRGRRVETEWGATYVPVDPKTELPEYIVDAAADLYYQNSRARHPDAQSHRAPPELRDPRSRDGRSSAPRRRRFGGFGEGQIIQLALRPPPRPLQGDSFEALRIIRDSY